MFLFVGNYLNNQKMESNINEAIIETQQFCKNLQDEISKLQRMSESQSVASVHQQITPHDVLHGKLIKLQTEIQIQKTQELIPPVSNPLAISSSLNEELHSTIQQTKKILQATDVRCTSLEKMIEDKENLIFQQNQLHDVMLHRLEDVRPNQSNEDGNTFIKSYDSELTTKKNNCEKQRREIRKKMSSFLNKHFPPPSTRQLKDVQTGNMTERIVPLEHIVDDLIALAINKPEDPYLSLGSQHWQQHIELLLSYGLASRHPSNINKIKMTDMHL